MRDSGSVADSLGSARSLRKTSSHPGPRNRSSSVSSTCSSSVVSSPPSVLRKGKFDVSGPVNAHPLPPPPFDLSLVYAIYGDGVCLYSVLHISPSAEDTSIRRAYLRQGRKALIEQGIAQKNDDDGCYSFVATDSPRKLEDVPHAARERFQAISIAYEILSNPEMKTEYDSYAASLLQPCSNDLVRSRSGNSVRWKPYVEEKIFHDSHPNERSVRRNRPPAAKREEGWLESHLNHLDEEADMFLSGRMFEEIDESIASFQESIGSLIKSAGSKDSSQGQKASGKTEKKDECSTGQVAYSSEVEDEDEDSRAKGEKAKKSLSIKAKAWQKLRGKSSSKKSSDTSVVDDSSQTQRRNSPPLSPLEEKDESLIGDFLDSPCSVFNVEHFGEYFEVVTSSLANTFIELLDGPENEESTQKETLKIKTELQQQIRDGFGEPFYTPSPTRKRLFSK